MVKGFWKKAIQARPLRGSWALLSGLALIAVPTLIRASVDGSVSGSVFLPYFPFVLVSALLLKPAHAAVVALVSAAMADLLFMHPEFTLVAGPSDLFGAAVFLVSSALMITVVQAARSLIADYLSPDSADATAGGIVFSSEEGQVRASWYSARPPVHLGPQSEVARMMADFLAQVELGERLTAQTRKS
jgi:hypothetical protein